MTPGALLIATSPRSGSWLLSDYLAGSGVIGVGREYFHVNYVPDYSRALGLDSQHITGPYIAAARQDAAREGVLFSSKVHWLQMNQLVDALRVIHPELAQDHAPAPALIEASLPGACYLHLTRRDKARQAISFFKAMRTDHWWERAGGPGTTADAKAAAPAPAPAPLEPPDHLAIRWFEEDLRHEDAEWQRFFYHFGLTRFAVAYEDLVADPRAVVRAVLDWLGFTDVAAPDRGSQLRRQADADSERALAEYLQIRDELPPRPPPGWQWSFTRRSFGLPDAAPPATGQPPASPPAPGPGPGPSRLAPF